MSETAAPSVLTESASAKASNATNMMAVECAGCSRPILDRFLLHFLDKTWHSSCVKCQVCRKLLDEKCFFSPGCQNLLRPGNITNLIWKTIKSLQEAVFKFSVIRNCFEGKDHKSLFAVIK